MRTLAKAWKGLITIAVACFVGLATAVPSYAASWGYESTPKNPNGSLDFSSWSAQGLPTPGTALGELSFTRNGLGFTITPKVPDKAYPAGGQALLATNAIRDHQSGKVWHYTYQVAGASNSYMWFTNHFGQAERMYITPTAFYTKSQPGSTAVAVEGRTVVMGFNMAYSEVLDVSSDGSITHHITLTNTSNYTIGSVGFQAFLDTDLVRNDWAPIHANGGTSAYIHSGDVRLYMEMLDGDQMMAGDYLTATSGYVSETRPFMPDGWVVVDNQRQDSVLVENVDTAMIYSRNPSFITPGESVTLSFREMLVSGNEISTVSVVYVDDDNDGAVVLPRVGTPTSFQGVADSEIGFTVEAAKAGVPQGYVFSSIENLDRFPMGSLGEIRVHLTHERTYSTMETTRTISYTGAGKLNPASQVQTLTWTVATDQLTGATSYSAASGYPEVISARVPGYYPVPAIVPATSPVGATQILPVNTVFVVTLSPIPNPPVITGPGDGDLTNDDTPTFTGEGDEPGNTVTVKDEDDKEVCTAIVQDDLTWSCTAKDPVDDGEHTYTATETDEDGNESDPSDPVTIVVDTTPPNPPVITRPGDGDLINDDRPTFAGEGDEPGNTVTVKDEDDKEICTAIVQANLTWSCTAESPVDDGEHTYTATETDEAGNESDPSEPVTIVVDTTPPNPPVITRPGDGDLINDDRPTFTGKGDEPGNIITVKDEDGNTLCTATVQSDLTWSCAPSTPMDDGDHTITAEETDPAGNTSTPSNPVVITVDTTAPGVPVITGPVNGAVTSNTSVEIVGTGDEPGNLITVLDPYDKVLCTAVVRDDQTWSCTPDEPLALGEYLIHAIETDEAGNISLPSNQVKFTVVSSEDPTVVTDPDDGDSGDKGDPGTGGDQGDKGDPGTGGDDSGDKGDPGTGGDQGDKGDPGAGGDQGDKGDPGAGGDQGDKGDPGTGGDDSGDKGKPGTGGDDSGDKGNPGTGGDDSGDKGDPGTGGDDSGDKGDPGTGGDDSGDKGNPGTGGDDQGDKGDPGTGGGDQGDKGNPGTGGGDQGDKGNPGSDGDDQGDKGNPGTSGGNQNNNGSGTSGNTSTNKPVASTGGTSLPSAVKSGAIFVVSMVIGAAIALLIERRREA
ncbi:MAG: Ig-like domain-containing protein [Propionibacteriaceae bacterium]|nr:Ig-like domain-containing protein [Propionibacteriaceae bacterium]